MNPVVEKYDRRVEQADSLLCVGLDSDYDRLPPHFQQEELPQFAFNRWIIEQTHAYVSAYKPNLAFYEARGAEGWRSLEATMEYLRAQHPDILTICDAKLADIGSTNRGYVTALFDRLGFDAVTLNPYLGQDALAPFLEREDKACILLCRTSNPGAGEFQDLSVNGKPLWYLVAEHVSRVWNARGNCMLVAGATYPDELRQIRALVGDSMTLLVPGIGAQGGDIEQTVLGGANSHGRGLIVSASRAVIFADDPASAAHTLRDMLNSYR